MTQSTSMVRLQDMARLNCPGVMDGSIRLEVYEVMKEFFQRSDSWLLELPVCIIPATNDYQICTGQNVVVNRLMSLERQNSPLPPNAPWPPQYLPMNPPQYLAVFNDEQPVPEAQNPLFRIKRSGVLLNAGSKEPIMRITSNPQANEMWIATIALTPCDPTDASGFVEPPDWVMEKYLSYIKAGVLRNLMLQPGKPYSSVQGASYHGRKFNEGVGLARTEVRKMFTYGSQRWLFPRGWNAIRPRLPSGQFP